MIQSSFENYKLSSELLKAIDMLNYKSPTKVQEMVIPAVLEHKDVIVKSQTGSGKTAAFAIPICDLVDWDENKPQVLVITPTRELAIQVKEDIFNLGRFKRLKVSAIYGRSSFYNQEKELKQKTHVVVGTPGRIIDHLERGTFDTSKIKYLIIDEADEMLSMGFVEQIEDIIGKLPDERTTILLSATLPKDIAVLCDKYMKNPVYAEIEEENKAIDRIVQERYEVDENDKLNLLRDITTLENPDSCIIFCSTKIKTDELFDELAKLNYTCEKIHGGMEQSDRLRVMNDFKQGYFRYLVATDVAARGIDIDDISLVINYDIPQDKESYVHRIGRTGRVDRNGKAITFVTPDESKYLDDIHKYIGKEIELKERPDKEAVKDKEQEFIEKMNGAPEIKQRKGEQLSRDIIKLHINAGKKTKMRPVDVVGTLCSIEGMSAVDIGIINIADVSTFVEILNNKGEMVLKELQKKPIKGKLRKVKKVEI
ncbi:DEAD/DEAH box helicase [Acetivibrio cellulolyticus]|uniref:DEAD/DEAH box helicase n=1 Tax=Acetivibrio cellulolyticus TaxID=35830 RepID=UPI0001E2F065|nr:DEAD/DEAH box helicase [Acetivibrio cellulolyticus]